jgi:hypothetical protein
MGSGLSVIEKKTMVEHLDFDNYCIFVFRSLALIVPILATHGNCSMYPCWNKDYIA